MSWIDVLDDKHFLRALFPDADPRLEGVRLHEIGLHQDGPAISLRFDLNEYPLQAPAKWQLTRANTVQVRLVGEGIMDLAISGWTLNNVGKLLIEPSDRGIRLEFAGGGCRITATVTRVRVVKVSAYLNDDRDRE